MKSFANGIIMVFVLLAICLELQGADAKSSRVPKNSIEEVDGIDSVLILPEVFDVYNLKGYKVRSKTTNLNGLPKGIYIINDKKVLVK